MTIETWQIRKPAVRSAAGLVASQHRAASEIGARVLADGGNAVDAAIAAGFSIPAVEPWMSGLGGGGQMLVWLAAERRAVAIDFGMVAPRRLDPADYPLTGDVAADLFAWPSVEDDRNLQGWHSIAVPTWVAGMELAHRRFASRPWANLLAPAIDLAEGGMPVDWYATLKIATGAAVLNRYAESRATYLPGGFPPAGEWGGPLPTIRLGQLAATLRRLAEAGARDFYEGEIARRLVGDLEAGGSRIGLDDLAAVEAREHDALAIPYRGHTVLAAPGLTAGPTLAHTLALTERRLAPAGTAPDGAAYLAYGQSLLDAYAERLAGMGDADESRSPSCTTHVSVIDRDGNMVALTQTLLSLFGSKVMLPETGILMNNGIMWFDPRPGRPNSIRPGRRPLSNMCPTVLLRDDGSRFALGASGGRRIMPAVFQLVSFLADYGMSVDEAFRQPRIDVSGRDVVTLDRQLAPEIQAAVADVLATETGQHGVYPALFACPNLVGRLADGGDVGAAFVTSPWAMVAAPG